jgi:hypothetical protein
VSNGIADVILPGMASSLLAEDGHTPKGCVLEPLSRGASSRASKSPAARKHPVDHLGITISVSVYLTSTKTSPINGTFGVSASRQAKLDRGAFAVLAEFDSESGALGNIWLAMPSRLNYGTPYKCLSMSLATACPESNLFTDFVNTGLLALGDDACFIQSHPFPPIENRAHLFRLDWSKYEIAAAKLVQRLLPNAMIVTWVRF